MIAAIQISGTWALFFLLAVPVVVLVAAGLAMKAVMGREDASENAREASLLAALNAGKPRPGQVLLSSAAVRAPGLRGGPFSFPHQNGAGVDINAEPDPVSGRLRLAFRYRFIAPDSGLEHAWTVTSEWLDCQTVGQITAQRAQPGSMPEELVSRVQQRLADVRRPWVLWCESGWVWFAVQSVPDSLMFDSEVTIGFGLLDDVSADIPKPDAPRPLAAEAAVEGLFVFDGQRPSS